MKKKMKRNTGTPAPRSITKHFPQVKTIIDAKAPVTVHVNKKDCSDSISLDANECALAKAVKREFKADAAVIGLSTSYIIKGTKAIRFDTGMRIAREIVSFDRNHDFEPGSYRLVPKAKGNKLGDDHRPKGNRKRDKRRDNHDAKRKTFGSARVRLLTTKSGTQDNA